MLRPLRFRLSIATKAMVLIGALGVLSSFANFFSWRNLNEVDRVDAVAARDIAPARLALSEAKIAVTTLGLDTYKLAGMTDPDLVQQAISDRSNSYATARLWLNGVLTYFPDRRDDIARILGKERRAHPCLVERGIGTERPRQIPALGYLDLDQLGTEQR